MSKKIINSIYVIHPDTLKNMSFMMKYMIYLENSLQFINVMNYKNMIIMKKLLKKIMLLLKMVIV